MAWWRAATGTGGRASARPFRETIDHALQANAAGALDEHEIAGPDEAGDDLRRFLTRCRVADGVRGEPGVLRAATQRAGRVAADRDQDGDAGAGGRAADAGVKRRRFGAELEHLAEHRDAAPKRV